MNLLGGLAWLVAVVLAERTTRRLIATRARAWIVAYLSLGAVALLLVPGAPAATGTLVAGLAGAGLAVVGYPAGRHLLGDRSEQPPPDAQGVELAALAGVVAPVEELVWGAIVEQSAGVPITAALFAIKHPLVDGRWGRTLGLFLFWLGLGLVRAVNWPAALVLHVTLNAAGVIRGHRTGVDQF